MKAMPSLDQKRAFVPVRIAVLTVSDTRTLADDNSGDLLSERIAEAGHQLSARKIVKDDIRAIRGLCAATGSAATISTSSSRPAAPALPAAT